MAGVVAGSMIQAGGIEGAVNAWSRAGGGSAGWAAARRYLQQQFPASTTQSRDAVIRYAQEQIRVGARYQRGGPDYAPELSSLPDVRRVIRSAGGVIPVDANGNPIRTVYHHVEITIRDINNPDRPAFTTFAIIHGRDPITRSELEHITFPSANAYLNQFREYDPTRLEQYQFEATMVIRGAYIGY